MTDLNGYLVAAGTGWRVPPYAQDMLWVQAGDQAVQTSGPRGKFTLETVSGANTPVTLAWGLAGGPPLAVWQTPSDPQSWIPDWHGTAAVGGFVERLHVLEVHGLELVLAEIEGELLPVDYPRLPGLEQMRRAPFSRRAVPEAAVARQFTYTIVMLADSIYAEYLHHAMVSELAVDCFAVLGPQDGHWHEIVGLPLLVESLSLLAPGYR